MTDWADFARRMLNNTIEPYWPIGPVPRDAEEAERRTWPWPLDTKDAARFQEFYTVQPHHEETKPTHCVNGSHCTYPACLSTKECFG